jgi:hypothetical protein
VSVGEDFIGDLFVHSETATFGGREMRIPARADHLFLALARPAAGDQQEIVLRAAEAGFLLRGGEGGLDWGRFVSLTRRYGDPAQTRALLDLVRRAGGAATPVSILSGLADGRAPRKLGTRLAGALPPSVHSGARRAAGRASTALRPRLRAWRSRLRPTAIGATDQALETVWRMAAAQTPDTARDGPAYLSGFSFPENEGRWTDGRLAALSIPVAAAGPVAVRLTAMPFCAPGEGQFVFDACVGPGTSRRHVIRFDEGVPAAVVVADAVVPGPSGRIVVALRLLDAGTPSHFGLSDDPRALGLMLQRIEIVVDTVVVDTIALGAPPEQVAQGEAVGSPSRKAPNAAGIASGSVPVSTT